MTFALNVVLASLAYGHGANVHSVNLLRPWLFLICLLVWLGLSRQSMRLPGQVRNSCVILGLLMCIEMYALLAAIAYIPVALTVLTFFTYPLLIAVAAHLRGKARLTRLKVAAMLVTFAGLALTLQASPQALNLLGVGLAFSAACALATVVYISEQSLQAYDNRVVMAWMMLSTTVCVSLICMTGLPLLWPHAVLGWSILMGSTVFYAVATFLLFTAVQLIGPLRTAVIDNSAPVWALLLGAWLLGEQLAPLQLCGAALVLLGIVTVQLSREPQTA
jgi:drug/metabolite transporter (DMT)-like permease